MYAFVSHTVMFKLDFYPSLIIPQSANTGLSRTFFLQADKVGHFSFFLSDFVWFSLKLKMEQTLEYCSSLSWAQNPKPSFIAFPNIPRYLLVKFHWILWHWLYYQQWGHPAILYPSAARPAVLRTDLSNWEERRAGTPQPRWAGWWKQLPCLRCLVGPSCPSSVKIICSAVWQTKRKKSLNS